MILAKYDAANIVADKIRAAGVSLNQFAKLSDYSNATISNWMSGKARLSPEAVKSLGELANDILWLAAKVHPLKLDFSAEDMKTVMQKIKDGRLAPLGVLDSDPECKFTKVERIEARERIEAGIAALSNSILKNEETGDATQ